jgi:hypothetical protein
MRHVGAWVAAAAGAAVVLAGCRERSTAEARAEGTPQRGNQSVAVERARPGGGGSADTAGDQAQLPERAGIVDHQLGQIEGEVAKSGADAIEIRTPDQPAMTLRVLPSTRVTLSGASIPPEQIQPGSDVRASFERSGSGEPVAISIEAKPSGGAAEQRSSGPSGAK